MFSAEPIGAPQVVATDFSVPRRAGGPRRVRGGYEAIDFLMIEGLHAAAPGSVASGTPGVREPELEWMLPWRRERRRMSAAVCICETRDSPIPRIAPTSFIVSSSR